MAFHRLSGQGNGSSGFSLIELLIAIVVAAILASIALPSYRELLRKSRRVDAIAALTDLSNRLERYYSDNNAYPTGITQISAFLTVTDSLQGYYTLSFDGVGTDSTATTFKIRATRNTAAAQADDSKCGDYTLTDQGVRAITGTGTLSECWPKN